MSKTLYELTKRGLDAAISGSILAVGWPAFLAIAAGIRLSSPGPIIFRQERVGRHGRRFVILKFRTMHVAQRTSAETFLGDPSVFGFGKFLREYHLDELPQLLNVLRGDMSIVGPRPTLPAQVDKYTIRQHGRHAVRPGITGLAQVSGSNELPWDERIEIDLEYVEKASLFLDVKILLRTVRTVLTKEGVYGKDGRVLEKR